MKINPGGRLAPESIIGRNDEVRRFWQILERQSLILTGERRLGKSHVMWKMESEGFGKYMAVYQDLEAVHSTTDFIRSIYRGVHERLTQFGKLKSSALGIWDALSPKKYKELELPNAANNWNALLRGAIADIEKAAEDGNVLLMWDEFPLMLDNISKSEGPEKAIQILDTLRELRQTHRDKLRFMFTGSIGLHIVLKSLRKAGHSNASVNDMHSETLPPMQKKWALKLAEELINTIAPELESKTEIANEIYASVGGFPYYIHHVLDQIQVKGEPITNELVKEIVAELIHADNDPAHLNYYAERITTYYGESDAKYAFSILDILANEDDSLAFEEILNRVRHKHVEAKDEEIREVIQLLRKDHYITQRSKEDEVQYDFRWVLIKQWWRKARS